MRLAIVGAGKMGGAVLTGALQVGVVQHEDVGIYHPDETRCQQLAARYQVAALSDNDIHHAERVLIGVKPQAFESVAPLIAQRGGAYISLMAGVSAETIAKRVGSQRVVRAMPNLGASIGMSATALTNLPQATQEDVQFAEALFQAIGSVYPIAERLFDAFTGLAGSGPAFVGVLAEALADGGVRVGFSRDVANDLTRQLLLATAHLLEQKDPAAIKNEVASAGGTAITGVMALEANGVRYALMQAVEQASNRATELRKADD